MESSSLFSSAVYFGTSKPVCLEMNFLASASALFSLPPYAQILNTWIRKLLKIKGKIFLSVQISPRFSGSHGLGFLTDFLSQTACIYVEDFYGYSSFVRYVQG